MSKFSALILSLSLVSFASISLADANVVNKKLDNGTPVQITDDSKVSVLQKDGTYAPAPDGTWTLDDGSKVTVSNGMKVN